MANEFTNLTIKRVGSLFKNGRVNMNIAIQRKADIWDKEKKSKLIQSILLDKPIPPIYANVAGEVYEIIDGKQRLSTVLQFLEDSFALTESIADINGIRVAGLRYSEMSDELKERVLNASFKLLKKENLSDEEKEDLFLRLNNGISLKTIENTRVMLGVSNMKIINELSEHPFLVQKTNVSNKRYTDQETILQILMLINNPETGFSSKEIRIFAQGIRGNAIPQNLIDTAKETMDYLNMGFDKKRKYLRKTHIPMVFHVATKALKEKTPPEYFAMWVDDYFENLSEQSGYWSACQDGSAKKENVQKRLSEITSAFNTYFQVQ